MRKVWYRLVTWFFVPQNLILRSLLWLIIKSNRFSLLLRFRFSGFLNEESQCLMNVVEFLNAIGFQRFEFFGSYLCDKAN